MGLAPVIDARTRVLILGSFPGAMSLARRQYYAYPQNQFWRLASAVTGVDLGALDYSVRLAELLRHRIGVWDVIAGCEREGSLDSAIRAEERNDFGRLFEKYPDLRLLAFNGQKAARSGEPLATHPREAIVLPSSSPAHASLRFEEKAARWCMLLASGRA